MGDISMSTYVDASMIPLHFASVFFSSRRNSKVNSPRTLTLQVFLQAFKADVSWRGEQQYTQILLRITTELFFLTERHQHRRHVRPHDAYGHKEQPQHRHAALEMHRQVGGVFPAGERLGT